MNKSLFLCGFGSGGTDLTKNLLNAHPDIYIASEISNLYYIRELGYDLNTVFSDLASVNKFQTMLRKIHGGHIFESIDYNFSREMANNGPLALEDVVKKCLSRRGKNASVWGAKVEILHLAVLSELFSNIKTDSSRFIE